MESFIIFNWYFLTNASYQRNPPFKRLKKSEGEEKLPGFFWPRLQSPCLKSLVENGQQWRGRKRKFQTAQRIEEPNKCTCEGASKHVQMLHGGNLSSDSPRTGCNTPGKFYTFDNYPNK